MSTVNHHKFPKPTPHAAQVIAAQTTTPPVEPVVQVEVVAADFINPSPVIGLNNTNVAVTQKKRGRPSKSKQSESDQSQSDKTMVTLRIDNNLYAKLHNISIKQTVSENKFVSIQSVLIQAAESLVRKY